MSVRVLVVDDETDVAMLFRQMFRRDLKQGRFVLDFAHSAPEALEKIDDGGAPLSVILSDINMPGMSGFELLLHCKSSHPELPVLMITAYGDEATRGLAIQRGADGLLTKPIDFGLLREEIEARVV